MATKKDMRRPDLIIPYQPPAAVDAPEFSSTLSSTLPMAAMFMRNKYVGWGSFIFSVQNYLGESEATKKNSSTPGYLTVGMSLAALIVTYLPIFLPPNNAQQLQAGTPSGTEAPAPAPLA